MGIWSNWYERNAGKENSLTSAEFVLKKIDESIKNIWPIGSIYMSVNNTNPSTYFPGTTWAAWGSGRVPVGVNAGDTDFGTVEKTGGAKTSINTSSGSGTSGGTSITEAQLPSHSHSQTGTFSGNSGNQSAKHRHRWYGDKNQGGESNSAYNAGNNGVSKFRGYDTDEETTNHTHSFSITLSGSTGTKGSGQVHTHTTPDHQHTISTLQPYITCYMWKRIT
jgi:hypothetical protein